MSMYGVDGSSNFISPFQPTPGVAPLSPTPQPASTPSFKPDAVTHTQSDTHLYSADHGSKDSAGAESADPLEQMMQAIQNSGKPGSANDTHYDTSSAAKDKKGEVVGGLAGGAAAAAVLGAPGVALGLGIGAIVASTHHSAVDYAGRVKGSLEGKEKDEADIASGKNVDGATGDMKNRNQQLYTQANKIEDAIRKQSINVHHDQTDSKDAGHLDGDVKKLKSEVQQFRDAAGNDPRARALVDNAVQAGLKDVQEDVKSGASDPGKTNQYYKNHGNKDGSLDPEKATSDQLRQSS